MTSSEQIQKHQLPSAIESLAKVEQLIDDLKVSFNIPEDQYGNILVSLSEAVNNAIKHGNQLDASKFIDLSFEFSDKAIVFSVKDQGQGFDYNKIPDPTHPDNIDKPDGRGIFIMKSLSDKVEFEENGSLVKIEFQR
ncbi:MAG: ATP-binding protein [Vicingaceae bacterium]